jgi:Xaa-Pro aminopeptidase
MPESRWQRIQELLRRYDIPAWFLYDFRGSNPLAARILGLPEGLHATRRWAVLIPAEGPPQKAVHRIEPHVLRSVEADERVYSTHHEWRALLAEWCQRYRRLAVEYSPEAALPTISLVDAGTVDLLRSFGAELVSSADLIQELIAPVTAEQLEEQARTADRLLVAVRDTFAWLREQLQRGEQPQEYAVQQHLLRHLEAAGLETDFPPIVARTERAANPHYSPTADDSAPIRHGDLVLVDLWARPRRHGALYADITWMAYAGETVPNRFADAFAALTRARDAAIALLRDAFARQQPVRGYEVDRLVRSLIHEAGYGELFIHRTGHSLGQEVHGPGANLDDYETHDTRRLLPGTAFTIEPGLYRDGDFGMRTEVDVQIRHDGTVVVCPQPVQRRIVPLLSPDWEESGWGA